MPKASDDNRLNISEAALVLVATGLVRVRVRVRVRLGLGLGLGSGLVYFPTTYCSHNAGTS